MGELSPDDGRPFVTAPIEKSDLFSQFRCGDRKIDDYFSRLALTSHQQGFAKVFVLRREGRAADLPRVIGFYTLGMWSIDKERLPARQGLRPPRTVPTILLGRLGVDQRAQGKRFGELLVEDALNRVLLLSEQAGCYGLVLEAKTERLIQWYESFGLVQIDRDGALPRAMILPIETLCAARAAASASSGDARSDSQAAHDRRARLAGAPD